MAQKLCIAVVETCGPLPRLATYGNPTELVGLCTEPRYGENRGRVKLAVFPRAGGKPIVSQFHSLTDADINIPKTFEACAAAYKTILEDPDLVLMVWGGEFVQSVFAQYGIYPKYHDIQRDLADIIRIPYPQGGVGFKPPTWVEAAHYFGLDEPETPQDKVRVIETIAAHLKAQNTRRPI